MIKIEKNKTNLSIISFLLAGLTVFSYGLNSALAVIPEKVSDLAIYGQGFFRFLVDLVYSAKTPDLFTVLICVGVAYLYKERLFKEDNIKSRILVTSVSAVIVFALLLCHSYSTTNSWDLVFGGKIVFAKSLIKVIGFTPLVYIVVDYLINLSPVLTETGSRPKNPLKTIAVTTLIFMACWLPYFILLYPGCMTNDAFDQLAQAINSPDYCWSKNTIVLLDENVILNNHHPLFYTGVMKLTALFAEAINSYETAFELLCIFQSLCLAGVFSYMLYVMQKHKVSKRYYKVTLLFFALNPLFPIYGMTVVKDTFFCAMFAMVAVQLYELLTLKKISLSRGVFFIISILVFLLTRNNSMYILILTSICIILLYLKRKEKMIKISALILVPVIVFQIGFINFLCPALKITSGSVREMLSVPFQQTARYIKEHRDEITEDEERIISTVLNCNGDIDILAEEYAGSFADNIKNRFNKYATTQDLVSYFKLWLNGLIKHPLTYIEGYFNLHYGWLSFEGNNVITYAGVGTWRGGEMIKEFDGYMGNASHRAIVSGILDILNKNPVTVLFLEMATYTWLYLLLLYHIMKRKNKQGFIVCTLAFFNYLISLVGPVAYMRYVIPMVCLAPFAIFIVFKTKGDKNNGQNSSTDTLLQ